MKDRKIDCITYLTGNDRGALHAFRTALELVLITIARILPERHRRWQVAEDAVLEEDVTAVRHRDALDVHAHTPAANEL